MSCELEQLGNAEVQELCRPVRSDEDVLRLDVAVDDEPLVGVRDAVTDLQKERETIVEREIALRAVPIDRHAVDVLHHEIGPTLGGRAAVEQPRDVGVLQPGEKLPLAMESFARVSERRATAA